MRDVGQNARMSDRVDLAPAAKREHIVKHQVSGRISDHFIAEIETALQHIPASLVDRVVADGHTLSFVETVLEARPDLRGNTPVGMPPGTTFENLRGFFDGETKTLYVPEYYRARLQPTQGLVKNTMSAAVMRHELGHALDRALGMASATLEFQRAYETDLAELQNEWMDDFAYFWQHDDARNRREIFAELFAEYYGGGPHDESRQLQYIFSHCNEILKKCLREILQ
jgi:hypothetical protein